MQSVFDYIKSEKEAYKFNTVPLTDGWEWSMYEHIRKSFLYKHSKFSEGGNTGLRPFKNIIRPILNVAHRSEGFDVKDIEPFVNDRVNFYKSFLVRKFHPRWARENDMDTFIDDLVESYVDYGLALVSNEKEVRPRVERLESIAFCDQSDILGGPICFLNHFTTADLMDMRGKWNSDAIDNALAMAEAEKASVSAETKTKTTGKYIETYRLHGELPKEWLTDVSDDDDELVSQMQIVSFYTDKNGKKAGLVLFSGRDKPLRERFKSLKRDEVFGRACGWGGIEELFEAQIWTNYSEIQIKEMLDVASKIITQTTDKALATQNSITEMEQGEILVHQEGGELRQVILQPINQVAFEKKVVEWEQQARTMGSADEALLGESPSSGTPFRLQALVTQEGKGIHLYRRGKVATFVGEIYRDWVLQYLVKEINKGQTFIEELSADELEQVATTVLNNITNQKLKEKLIRGVIPSEEEKSAIKQIAGIQFQDAGSKRFIEILKDEIKDIPVDVEINIAGKQKDLADQSEKLTNIFRAVFQNPAMLQTPGMGQLFNEILESSGFSPLNFSSFKPATTVTEQQATAQLGPRPARQPRQEAQPPQELPITQ